MNQTQPERSNRSFTKRLVVANMLLIWVLILLSVIYQQAEHVVPAGMALIGSFFAVYTGVGHLDYRKVIELSVDRLTKGNKVYDE